MAYIKLNNDMPGIVGLLWTKPNTGKALSKLANALMMDPSSLSSGEREMIAARVSYLNNCNYCCNSHSAAANWHLHNTALVESVKQDPQTADVSSKMKSLLSIAEKVQQSGKSVTGEDCDSARKAGATDEEIHETVLIAAAFCMFNRYVDGLGALEPEDKEEYKQMGLRRSVKGYGFPPFAWQRSYLNNKRNNRLALKKH